MRCLWDTCVTMARSPPIPVGSQCCKLAKVQALCWLLLVRIAFRPDKRVELAAFWGTQYSCGFVVHFMQLLWPGRCFARWKTTGSALRYLFLMATRVKLKIICSSRSLLAGFKENWHCSWQDLQVLTLLLALRSGAAFDKSQYMPPNRHTIRFVLVELVSAQSQTSNGL